MGRTEKLYGNKAYQTQRAAIWHGVSDATFAAMHSVHRDHLIRTWRREAFQHATPYRCYTP